MINSNIVVDRRKPPTPKVQYAYSALDAANRSRLTSMTYPNGRVVGYNYAAGLDSTISRLSSITDSGVTLESYSYLGLGTVVVRAHAQTGVDLSSVKLSGESVGDAGDQVTGLDRFGRIVDQRWRAGGVDQFRLRIGRHVQMRAVDGRIDGEQLDPHRLAEEQIRPPGVETEECLLHDRPVWTRFAEQVQRRPRVEVGGGGERTDGGEGQDCEKRAGHRAPWYRGGSNEVDKPLTENVPALSYVC